MLGTRTTAQSLSPASGRARTALGGPGSGDPDDRQSLHEVVLKEARAMARRAAEAADDGTNDLLVSDVIRTNETQVWFVPHTSSKPPTVHTDEE